MDILIKELRIRWVALQEVMEYTGLNYNKAWRLIDNLTKKYPLGETKKFNISWFKIMNTKDYEEISVVDCKKYLGGNFLKSCE
jgi:hypothetical protein